MKQEWKKTVAASLLLLVLLVLVMGQLVGENGKEVLSVMKQLPLWAMVLLCIFSVGYLVVDGLIMTVLARGYDRAFPLGAGLLSGFYMGAVRAPTFGMASAPALVLAMTRQNISVEWAAGMAGISYGIQKLAIALLAGVGLFWCWPQVQEIFGQNARYVWMGYGLTVAIVAAILVCFLCPTLHGMATGLLRRLPNPRAKRLADALDQRLSQLRSQTRLLLAKRKRLAVALGLNGIKLLFWYAMPYVVLSSTQSLAGLDFGQVVSFTALTMALAGVIPTPGGVASVEILFTMLFAPAVGEPVALAAMVLYRFFSYYAACFLAWLVLLLVNGAKKWKRRAKGFSS